MAHTFEFTSELWEYGGAASWYFVTVPQDASDEIADLVPRDNGFGSVRVEVAVGSSKWATSLFPSKELAAYVLPVKRAIRDSEQLRNGDPVDVVITLADV